MPYKLVQTSPGNVDVTNNLESFLFCYNFTVEKGSQNIIISSGILTLNSGFIIALIYFIPLLILPWGNFLWHQTSQMVLLFCSCLETTQSPPVQDREHKTLSTSIVLDLSKTF